MNPRLVERADGVRPRVLFISYNGLLDPLGPSQVVPYVRGLAPAYRMSVLSFEKGSRRADGRVEAEAELERSLRRAEIRWIRMRYHKYPTLPATLFDAMRGIACVVREHQRDPIALVHARGYVPAAIAWGVKRRVRIPYLFDIRGLQAEEYVDARHWRAGGVKFRLTKYVEQRLLADADALVTLTQAVRPFLQACPGLAGRAVPPPWEVIPCCTDVEHFRFDAEGRRRVRAELGLGERPVAVYAGSVGSWYLLDEMLEWYLTARRRWPRLALLLLINGEEATVRRALGTRHLSEGPDVVLRSVRHEAMPAHLSAADIGIAFIRSCISKRSSSPTKIGEYLACGLPVVINTGIGDLDELVTRQRVGVILRQLDAPSYEEALAQLARFLEDPEATRRHCRAVAKEQLALHEGVSRYAALYQLIGGGQRHLVSQSGGVSAAAAAPLHAPAGVP